MDFTERQKNIIKIVTKEGPITGDEIALKLNVSRATIRPDLSVLTMIDILGARPKVGYYYIGKEVTSYFLDKVKSILVKDVMSLPVVVDESTSIYDVIVSIFLKDISSIFITNDNYLTGVVSRKDLLRTTMGGLDLKGTPIGVIMTRMPNIIYAEPNDNIYDISVKIEKSGIDGIPIVERIGETGKLKVVGRFTKTNVTRLFVDFANNEI